MRHHAAHNLHDHEHQAQAQRQRQLPLHLATVDCCSSSGDWSDQHRQHEIVNGGGGVGRAEIGAGFNRTSTL